MCRPSPTCCPAGVNLRTGCGLCSKDHVLLAHCPSWRLDIHCLLPGSGTALCLCAPPASYCVALPTGKVAHALCGLNWTLTWHICNKLSSTCFDMLQVFSTLIAALGLNGYNYPDTSGGNGFENCQFCRLGYSNDRAGGYPAFFSHKVPQARTENQYIDSVIGCT